MILGSPASEEIVPTVAASERLRFGSPKFVVLKTLNTSQRRIAPILPVTSMRRGVADPVRQSRHADATLLLLWLTVYGRPDRHA